MPRQSPGHKKKPVTSAKRAQIERCMTHKQDGQVLTSRQGWKAELLWVYSHEGKGLLLKQPTDN